ncbi:hypothetical protein EXIGLDRAFT_779947 [Exidia glandulosa HHB12029]|uniref:Uncharacterized protein n=1 Tax=Exidia glandulosa HHB12029 TaxID=1314781 RepID=A0A165BTS9_EXIGL|nr:hypothetical protein EXIGLDRAFT_779947 [Exidia glandulosa HHB12029]
MTSITSAHVSARSLEVLRNANLGHAPEFLDFREKHWGKAGAATVPVPQELVELGVHNPLVFIQHTDGFDDDLGDSPILVRAEYRRLWRYIYGDFFDEAAEPDKRACTATIVLGHPGIGKSLSLFYLMVVAAEARLPFVFYRTGFSNAYVCLDAGDFSIPAERLYYLQHTARTLVLLDSSADLELREYTWRRSRNTHAVLASSPANQRHGALAKYRKANYYTMDVVPLHEFRAMMCVHRFVCAEWVLVDE